MNRRSNVAGGVLLAAVLIAPARTTLLGMSGNLRAAAQFARETPQARRSAVWGGWYDATRELRGSPLTTTIDVVILTPESRDVALFAGTSLAPRPCHYFTGWDGWKKREPAVFFHDRDAANAVGRPPQHADVIIVADVRREPAIHIASREELAR